MLNEMEWLPKLYEQHKNWPDLIDWVFVESADQVYQSCYPNLVTSRGLSTDGTTEFLTELAAKDPRVTHIKYGTSVHDDNAMGKIPSRNAYMEHLEYVQPTHFMVLDADEFYCHQDQAYINAMMDGDGIGTRHFCFQFTHIWHPPSILDEPLFQREIKGGFWDMRHTKGVRWEPGMRYSTSHQRPEVGEAGRMSMYDSPSCIHMAFASEAQYRLAKNNYYRVRGEWADIRRRRYCVSRDLFRTWTPNSELPQGVQIVDYTGPVPECFITDKECYDVR